MHSFLTGRSIQTGRSILTVAAVGAALLVSSSLPARAENPVETLRDGAAKAIEALRALAGELQRYGSPYFDKNGNIVIPRDRKLEEKPEAGGGKVTENGTVAL